MLDTAIRNATIITAGDRVKAEIGIRDGRIVAIAEDVGPAVEEIDASGLWVMPGGIDSARAPRAAVQGAKSWPTASKAARARRHRRRQRPW
jgi:dihydroorotase-like cyclic amidohydrolase